eukprot:jgi/Chlat1/2886/Chrsp2S04651
MASTTMSIAAVAPSWLSSSAAQRQSAKAASAFSRRVIIGLLVAALAASFAERASAAEPHLQAAINALTPVKISIQLKKWTHVIIQCNKSEAYLTPVDFDKLINNQPESQRAALRRYLNNVRVGFTNLAIIAHNPHPDHALALDAYDDALNGLKNLNAKL